MCSSIESREVLSVGPISRTALDHVIQPGDSGSKLALLAFTFVP
jgi:hypothetical protein